jgi:hypothetical protein
LCRVARVGRASRRDVAVTTEEGGAALGWVDFLLLDGDFVCVTREGEAFCRSLGLGCWIWCLGILDREFFKDEERLKREKLERRNLWAGKEEI